VYALRVYAYASRSLPASYLPFPAMLLATGGFAGNFPRPGLRARCLIIYANIILRLPLALRTCYRWWTIEDLLR